MLEKDAMLIATSLIFEYVLVNPDAWPEEMHARMAKMKDFHEEA